MGSERVRSMVPALTFGTAKSKVELRVARRGKISLRGSGIFTPDELAQVVEQVQNWVQQLRQPAGMTSSQLQQTFPPLPADSRTVPDGLSGFRGEPFAPDVAEPAAPGSWSGNRSSGSTNSSGIGV